MDFITPEIEYTDDGTQTMRHPLIGERYHSTRGAVGEAMHVFILNGLKEVADCGKRHIRVFEMGFGSGLNAWLTLDFARRNGLTIDYRAVEKYPISPNAARELRYTNDALFMELHNSEWNRQARICECFELTKTEGDLAYLTFDTIFDLIYYDAFAPESQPELWTTEIFGRFFDSLDDGGLLVTYSAKGTVKEALRGVGFEVKRKQGALGKRHMVAARKPMTASEAAEI